VLNAVERLARGYGVESERTRQDLGIAEAQLRDYQARLGQPFLHAAYLDQLAALRDQLKVGLSGAAPQEGEPTIAELAERIKALRAANAVEATPERTGQRKFPAEEPVTARIRRRNEAIGTTEPAVEPAAAPPEKPSPPEPTAPVAPAQITLLGIPPHDTGPHGDSSRPPEKTYQNRIATGRRRKEYQLKLF
jgi:cell pole-organizing protein PopZ